MEQVFIHLHRKLLQSTHTGHVWQKLKSLSLSCNLALPKTDVTWVLWVKIIGRALLKNNKTLIEMHSVLEVIWWRRCNITWTLHVENQLFQNHFPFICSCCFNLPMCFTVAACLKDHRPCSKEIIHLSVCSSVWVCGSYLVQHFVDTELCCAPLTCFVHYRPALCTMTIFHVCYDPPPRW